VPHAHVLERALGRERLAPDREVRLGVHRRFLDERQDRAPVDLAGEQRSDVVVAPRHGVRRIEPEDRRIERARPALREVREHAQERHPEPRELLHRAGDARQLAAALELRLGPQQPVGGDAHVVEREVGERADLRQPARGQPLREALAELLRQRELGARAPLIDGAVGPPREQHRGLGPRRIEAELEPQHLVAPRHAEEPVDRLLDLRVVRVEEPPGVVDEPLVVVIAERHDPVADEVIEHDHRDEPRDVHPAGGELGGHGERAREERRAVRVGKRPHERWRVYGSPRRVARLRAASRSSHAVNARQARNWCGRVPPASGRASSHASAGSSARSAASSASARASAEGRCASASRARASARRGSAPGPKPRPR
jgi:hypothetical protein